MEIIEKIKNKYKKMGSLKFGVFILRKIFGPLFYFDTVNAYQLDLSIVLPKIKTPTDLSIRFGTPDDLKKMDEGDYDFSDSDKLHSESRMKKGDKFIIGFYKNKIAGYKWIMNGYIDLTPEHFYPIPPNKVYLYKAFIIEEFRGKRIALALLEFAIDDLKKDKIQYILAFINKSNRKSINAFHKIGIPPIGKFYRLVFFKKKKFVFLGKNIKEQFNS